MAKDLVFSDESCKHLDLLASIPDAFLPDCCEMGLQQLLISKVVIKSTKSWQKAASKLNVDAGDLENCMKSLASLFLELTKQLKSLNKVITSLEMLGIPHVEILANFWMSKVRPMIGDHNGKYMAKVPIIWRMKK